jgi:hypothetical protein
MAAVRSGALNLYRKNGLKAQAADIEKMFKSADVLSLSEVHGNDLARWAKENGYTFYKGPDDTAIIAKGRYEIVQKGAQLLNKKTGSTPGMRRRTAAYALLRDTKSGEEFWQISAHTTPPRQGSAKQRAAVRKEQYQSIAQLAKRLGKGGTGVIMGGDLNRRDPNIKGLESGHDGGIIHVAGSNVSTLDTSRVTKNKLNSDHAGTVTKYALDGGGNDRVDVSGWDYDNAEKTGGNPAKRRGGKSQRGDDGSTNLKDYAADYGWSLAFLRDNPQLKEVFDMAIDNNWSPARFIAEVQDTNWFKKHSDTWRQAIYLQATDPKTYQQRQNQIRASIADQAGALGIEVGDKVLNRWSEQALRLGWTDGQVRNHLARQVKIMGEHTVGGELASTQEGLNRWAVDNGVKVNKKTMQSWLREIVRGNSTLEEYKQYITKMAVAQHPNWSKELRAGMSVAEIAEPYRNMAAQMLEMAPDDIDLNGRLLKQALSYKREDGKYDAMTMYDFEDKLRQDPRWMKTDNAKEQFMGTGSAVLKMFGLST